jgi:DNAJ protein RME-8 N-terminal
MAAVDHLLHFRKAADGQTPPDCIGRFLVTKHSWRGKYRRIFCITPSVIVTQHPDTLSITNTWTFLGDPDIDNVGVGGSTGDERDFSISARKDKKVQCNLDLCNNSATTMYLAVAFASRLTP